MPPKIKFSKADLLHAAFKLTREKGIAALNARAVARELGCSTQPIFRAFASMQDVKAEIIRMASDMHALYLARVTTQAGKPYLAAGMAYIAFADDEPELFKLLFMCDRVIDGTANDTQDMATTRIIDMVERRTGLTREQAEQFHEQIWIFTHGLATMIATRFINFSRERAEQLLTEEYLAARMLYGLGPPEDERE
jgi:AcrR family transcriptional regulator